MTPITKSSNHQTPTASDREQAYRREQEIQAKRSGNAPARFPFGRRKAILKIMHHRCGGECLTDDRELFVDLLLPFQVEASCVRRHRDIYDDARRFFRRAMPTYVEAFGIEDIDNRVQAALQERAVAEEMYGRGSTGYVEWLPKVGDLVAALRVTREEVRHLDLRGWTSIDPANVEERREADRVRKKAARAAAGATPREQSAARTEPWKALGLTKRTWQRRKSARTLQSGAISSAPPVDIYGPDESAPHPTVPPVATNDDTPTVTKAGYHGRHVTFTAAWVDILVSAAPHIADDLVAHLDAVDALMAKTPERNHRAVSLNLCRDRSQMVLRSRRKASTALAA